MSNPPKIFIVEDDEFLARIYGYKLEQEGYRWAFTIDGVAAVKKIAYERPDLVMLELDMPQRSGFDIISELRANPETRDLPVMVVTKIGDSASVKRALDAGAAAYMIKTQFTFAEVLTKIREVFAARGAK